MIDSTGFAELVACKPTMFHLICDCDDAKLDSILSNGIERASSHFEGFWESRPGHVYMADAATLRHIRKNQAWAMESPAKILQVDVAQLDPRKLNPDEDHFQTDNFLSPRNNIGGRHACSRFHREFPPSSWLYEWGKYLQVPLPSLGEWADAVDLGSDPAETRYSAAQGSIAYDGVVPPAALKVLA